MFRVYRRWKKKRAIQKIKPGDGQPLKQYRWWQMIYRSLFFIKIPDEDGIKNIYAVNINYFSEDEDADLYCNGKHDANSKLPAIFPVPGGVIEVATTTYGVKRMHYVKEDGREQQLFPHPHSAEGLRMKFDFYFPRISKFIGVVAVIILLTSLVLGLPQLIELITQFPFIQDRWGTFKSPIILPNWLNGTLVVLATLATIERAITLRSHWLIDMETWWEEFHK